MFPRSVYWMLEFGIVEGQRNDCQSCQSNHYGNPCIDERGKQALISAGLLVCACVPQYSIGTVGI